MISILQITKIYIVSKSENVWNLDDLWTVWRGTSPSALLRIEYWMTDRSMRTYRWGVYSPNCHYLHLMTALFYDGRVCFSSGEIKWGMVGIAHLQVGPKWIISDILFWCVANSFFFYWPVIIFVKIFYEKDALNCLKLTPRLWWNYVNYYKVAETSPENFPSVVVMNILTSVYEYIWLHNIYICGQRRISRLIPAKFKNLFSNDVFWQAI